jgi:imidazolonepropionase-like amidohydrolase
VAPRASEHRCDEGHVAGGAQCAKLGQAEPIGEHEDDLPYTFAEGRLERAQRRRVGLVANAEDLKHGGGDVDQPATVIVRRYEAARAETVNERVGHRRTILPSTVRRVFEVDGLFDGARTMTNAAIVIDGGNVVWVGQRNAIPKTPQGERSEVTPSPGAFVLPGMINCHCHLTLDGEPNFGVEVRQSDALATLKAFGNARAALRAGVTTVRDLSANGTMVIELGRAIEKGILEGPRVLAAGRGVTTTGGHGFEVGRIADGPDEVRKAVREQVAAGAGVIKLFSTGGILGDGAPPEVSQYTPEETAAAVAEAHNAGLRITTHAHGSGIDSIEHATLLDEKTVRLIKERDVAIVPTLLVVHSLLEHADALDPVVLERTRAVSERHREGVRMAHKAGIRIATGTDAGAPFTRHDRFAMEPQLLAECGLSTEQALVAATGRAADVVGLEKAGHIGAGCWADLVFVDGDPLKDLSVLRAPKGVYVRGIAAL